MKGQGLKKGPYVYKFLAENSRTELSMSIKRRVDRQKERRTKINKIDTINTVTRSEADEKLRQDPDNYTRPDIMLNDKMLAEFDVCK